MPPCILGHHFRPQCFAIEIYVVLLFMESAVIIKVPFAKIDGALYSERTRWPFHGTDHSCEPQSEETII